MQSEGVSFEVKFGGFTRLNDLADEGQWPADVVYNM